MENINTETYLELLKHYNELIGCPDTEILNPFDGRCYLKDS